SFSLLHRRPPPSPLFPYTTLFRSAISPDTPSFVDCAKHRAVRHGRRRRPRVDGDLHPRGNRDRSHMSTLADQIGDHPVLLAPLEDRKSTRLNSSHVSISYAVFCLK